MSVRWPAKTDPSTEMEIFEEIQAVESHKATDPVVSLQQFLKEQERQKLDILLKLPLIWPTEIPKECKNIRLEEEE